MPRERDGSRRLEQCIPPAHREAAEAMLDASFFEDPTVLRDCREVVRALAGRYDVRAEDAIGAPA